MRALTRRAVRAAGPRSAAMRRRSSVQRPANGFQRSQPTCSGVLIDLQEGYRTALHAWERVVVACRLLVEGMAILGVPILVTEQYPRGLGHSAPEVAGRFPAGLQVIEKMSMSCCAAAAFTERLAASGRRQVLIAGLETHACVNQTVHDLLALGYPGQVARDATPARRPP